MRDLFIRLLTLSTYIGYVGLFLSACSNDTDNELMRPSKITFTLNQPVNEFLDENSLDQSIAIRQPMGVNFFQYRWPSANKGTLQFDYESYSFELPFAVRYTGNADENKQPYIIRKNHLSAAFSQDSKIMHEDACRYLMNFVRELEAKGWKRYNYHDDPRLLGKEAVSYAIDHDMYPLPERYNLTMEEWMTIDTLRFAYYAGNAFLKFEVSRNAQKKDIDKLGEYYLSMTIFDRESEIMQHLSTEQRKDWKNAKQWQEIMKRNYFERYKREAILEAKGYTIDRNYKDPITHPADPVVFDPETYVPN